MPTIEKTSATRTASEQQLPRTKLDLVYAIKDLLGITQRGVLEVYEFEQMRKRSLVALYEALRFARGKA